MEKLRFTQLFHESEKVSKDEEKLDIILKAVPDDEKAEVKEDYQAAQFDNKLEEFFDKYKDILDNAQTEESNDDTTSETDSSNEIESSDEKPTEDENLDSDNTNSDVEADEESEEQLEMEEESAASQDSTIKNGKSTLNLNDKYHDRLVEVLGITPNMEKDFEKYEEYFGYTSTGKKDSVKVMFRTPEYWPIKTGDSIKSDNPLFHTVACMNEFLIWKMGVQIYNSNPKIKGIFNTVLNSGKAGSALNAHVKEHADETKKNVRIAIEEIRTGSTVIDDPFETGEDITQNNNIILFMFTKIFPTLLNVAKTGTVGGKFASATSKILGEDSLYGKLYLIGRGEYDATPKDVLNDLILDSYVTFLGGRFAVRAPYESEIKRGRTLFGNAVAKPLCIFDDNWLENESAKAKNIYQKMDTAFSEKNEKFEIRNARKTKGKGSIKAIGLTEKAYALAIEGATDDELKFQLDQDEITQKDVDDVKKARQYITIETIELEPFAYIANTVGADFNNFLSCMTRVGANKVGILDVYGKQYYSEEDIENEKDPKKKEEMLEINKRWANARIKIGKFNPMSMDAPTTGKDGDTGTTLGDLIADKVHGISEGDKDIVKQNMNALVNHLKAVKTFVDSLPERNIKEISEKINGYYSIICQSRFEYIGLREPRITAKGALNMVVGKQPGSGKNLGQLVDLIPIQKMGNWGLHTDGSGGKPIGGMGGNFNPNEDSISFNHGAFNCYSKVRSLPGLYYINYTEDGNLDFKKYVNSLKSLYNYSRSKIFELLEKGGLNIDDKGYGKKGGRIISGQLYAPNEIRDNGEIIERIPISLTSMDVPYTDINDYLVDSPYCQWRIASRAKTMSPAQLRKFRNDPETEDFRNELKKRHDFDVNKAIDTMNKDGIYDKENLNPQGVQLTANPDGGLVFTNSDSDFGNPEIHDNFSMDYVKGNKVRYNQEVNTDNFKVTGGYNKADESMFDFFGEVFREASEKEKTKKQRFTIN